VYGHLCVNPTSFGFAHRSELNDLYETDPDRYELSYPSAWNAEWLRVIVTPERFRLLARDLTSHLQTLLSGRTTVANSMKDAVRHYPLAVERTLLDAVKELNFSRVVEDWRRAQREVALDPPAAVTAACRLLETTLKHIIESAPFNMPDDKSIHPLYKEVARG
jgi:hypothetical protein